MTNALSRYNFLQATSLGWLEGSMERREQECVRADKTSAGTKTVHRRQFLPFLWAPANMPCVLECPTLQGMEGGWDSILLKKQQDRTPHT